MQGKQTFISPQPFQRLRPLHEAQALCARETSFSLFVSLGIRSVGGTAIQTSSYIFT